jgi:peptidoglycan endopeptidase LytE
MKKQLLTVAATAGFLFTSFNGSASAHEQIYSVKSGDNLWKLAQTYNVSVNNLQTWNSISGSTIYVNQKLSVLAPHTHAATANASVPTAPVSAYVVKSGDSLWVIAKRNNLSLSQLKSINNLKSDLIFPGQVLKLSGSVSAPIATNVSNASAPVMATYASSSKVSALIAEAKKYIGVPYVWAGSTPSGFDCSGYLNYVYAKSGISIPRTVATIWNATKPVSALRSGDLVFFETYKTGPSHAGIYLGNNKFIHAGSSRGVEISDMTNSYWQPRYLGAKTTF